jgi:hypothetical protein
MVYNINNGSGKGNNTWLLVVIAVCVCCYCCCCLLSLMSNGGGTDRTPTTTESDSSVPETVVAEETQEEIKEETGTHPSCVTTGTCRPSTSAHAVFCPLPWDRGAVRWSSTGNSARCCNTRSDAWDRCKAEAIKLTHKSHYATDAIHGHLRRLRTNIRSTTLEKCPCATGTRAVPNYVVVTLKDGKKICYDQYGAQQFTC